MCLKPLLIFFMRESDFQRNLVRKIKNTFKGSLVFKGPSNQYQGIPDLIILYKNKWAALECKQTLKSKKQNNQPYYVKLMNEMSFARVIAPENEKEVMDDLQRAFET